MNINLIFSNKNFLEINSFKYEMECIIKLFFHDKKVTLSQDFSCESDIFDQTDFCFARVKKCKTFTYLFTVVRIGSISKRICKKLMSNDDNFISIIEISLAKMFYLSLSEITNNTPKWGNLTGVLPVKRVNNLNEQGKSNKQI